MDKAIAGLAPTADDIETPAHHALAAPVTHVRMQEVGHHFCLYDADMHAPAAAAG